ncbi:unnamed protein product [Allacma fusca]|uniref:C2H2-type domain-containing protein n=1 Tax=Allacma fusca TaxID=39272 RepID=A0A8J2JZY4_9HEXA|nr:unnamed protein product [Allacma fusca]
MDVVEDDSNLFHSKFRKARRGYLPVVSRLTTTTEVSSGLLPVTGNCLLITGPSPSTTFTGAAFPPNSGGTPEDSMHTTLDLLPQPPSSGRLEALYSSGTKSPLSPLCGTNILVNTPASPNLQPTTTTTPAGNNSILSGTAGITGSAHPAPQIPTTFHCEVFRFDSTDRERYLCNAISEEEEVFSPGPSPSSSTRSYDSPHIILDSPRITISPLHISDDPTPPYPPQPASVSMDSQNRLMARVHTGLAMLPSSTVEQTRCLFGVPSSPVSPLTPNTPLSPSPLFNSDQTFQQGFLAELYRRRCHSDSDLPLLPESPRHEPTDLSIKSGLNAKSHPRPRKPIPHPLTIPSKGGSLESDQSSPQDSPLDLSVKGSRERFGSSTSCESLTSRFLSSLAIPQSSPGHSPGVAVVRGDIASPTTRNSVALRYNLEVSPVVEEMPPGSDMAFVCPICGQMFSLHDRLAKHMASRHKSKPHDPNKSYPCDVCHRSFARSDMLTRHMRLHTGVKPYTCRVCGQVFSRSDHLSTHQRTHTGEKPYKCPQCPYSACRRDMITRHLRTHTRNSSSSSSDLLSSTSTNLSDSMTEDRSPKVEQSRPPSSSSSFAPDSPLSPVLSMNSLSVHSPPPISRD